MLENNFCPLEIFERYRPKFRRITFGVGGIGRDTSRFFSSESISGSMLHLSPQHVSGKDVEGLFNASPSIDLEQLNLRFSVEFDASKSMYGQFIDKLERALLAGPFKGRSFFMDPVLKCEKATSLEDYTCAVRFAVEGGEVPGLDLGNMTTRHQGWKVYIPSGPERQAIETAISLQDSLEKSGSIPLFSELRQQLAEIS